MADYISREAAIEELCKAADCVTCSASAGGLCGFCTIGNASRLIRCLPAADVEPVRHGRWEGYTNSRYVGCDQDGEPIYRDGVIWYCSNPKCRRRTVVKEKFCPNCGAKMDLEDEE